MGKGDFRNPNLLDIFQNMIFFGSRHKCDDIKGGGSVSSINEVIDK